MRRGEIWIADLDPVVGHEQGRRRPVLIVSTDRFNQGSASLVIVVPLTTADRHLSSHVEILPPDGGVKQRCFAMCEMVRSISKDRLTGVRWGRVSDPIMRAVEDRLTVLLEL